MKSDPICYSVCVLLCWLWFRCFTKHLGKTEHAVKYRLQCCDMQFNSSKSVQVDQITTCWQGFFTCKYEENLFT